MRTTYVYGIEFWNFYNAQTKPVQEKIDWVVGLVRSLKIIPEKFFKHIEGTDGLYEIRVKVNSDIFRIFCFFDKGNLIILLSGFQKKTRKTPQKEIKLAERLKKQYYEKQQKQ
ncbi:type II toxin-antitoxin system RelE/ParE family toxin [Dyadobacter bucti]|uniref:type II toxin-antitoxin system RelE/ParE family toxin n=1 Tax=Dyadobacter bucti TaxID=2572203 RepID=UPI003F70BBA6